MNLATIMRHKFIAAILGGVALTGLLVALGGSDALGVIPFLIVAAGLLYGLFLFASGPLARLVARVPWSVRWKLLTVIGVTAALLVGVAIINIAAMNYMHDELHKIQTLEYTDPSAALAEINELENQQHELLGLTPMLGLLAMPIVLGLGVAVGWSVIRPVQRMGETMEAIAAGDFQQTMKVENRDELGGLATRINDTAKELGRLQETTLAAERARALRDRITRVTLAQEEERRRISRELHDGLGPSLAGAVNRLRACQQTLRGDPDRAERELDEVTLELKNNIQDIRHLIYDLRPQALDQLGVVGSIRQQVERLGEEGGVRTVAHIQDDLELDPLLEATVFRVVQECLSNVRRHSGATRVAVSLYDTEEGIELVVEDDGSGFDPDGARNGAAWEGVGLVSMRERADLVGGRLSVDSAPGAGCTVRLRVPSKEVPVGAHSSTAG
jgi:signal transduction histidine kinase